MRRINQVIEYHIDTFTEDGVVIRVDPSNDITISSPNCSAGVDVLEDELDELIEALQEIKAKFDEKE